MSEFSRSRKKHPKLKFVGRLFVWLMLPFIANYVVDMYLTLFVSYSPLLDKYKNQIIIIIFSIIFISFAYLYLKGLIKRRKFLRRLKKICIAKGFTLLKLSSPYLTVFVESDTPELIVETGDAVYILNLFRVLNKNIALHFTSPTTVTVISNFFKALPPRHKVKSYAVADIELPSGISKEKRVEKMLIMNPSPYRITRLINNVTVEVDNNERMFGYTLYNATGLCSMLNRLEEVSRK